MVNDGHLKNLHDETDVWNRWREDNAHVMPALHRADLGAADFSDATCTDGSKCAQGTIGGCNGG